MKKIVYLLVITSVIILGYVQLKNDSSNSIIDNSMIENKKNAFYCESNSDCIPFVFECGTCANNTIAINAKYMNEYQEKYFRKCAVLGYRMCEAVPSGSSTCIKNKCELIINKY